MTSTQEPTQSGGASTLNFLTDSNLPKTDSEPVASDLPADFFSQISGSKIEAAPAASEAAPAKTFFAHTVDAGASVLGESSAQEVASTSDAAAQESALDPSVVPAVPISDDMPVAETADASTAGEEVSIDTVDRSSDASALASILSADAADSGNPSVDDVYRDMVRQSLSSERAQGGISRVRTYTVALVALVLGGGGLYAYSNDMVSFVPPEEEAPIVLDSAPVATPAAASGETDSGKTSTSATRTGSVSSDAPALDLVPRDSGVIANKKRNNNVKRRTATGTATPAHANAPHANMAATASGSAESR